MKPYLTVRFTKDDKRDRRQANRYSHRRHPADYMRFHRATKRGDRRDSLAYEMKAEREAAEAEIRDLAEYEKYELDLERRYEEEIWGGWDWPYDNEPDYEDWEYYDDGY